LSDFLARWRVQIEIVRRRTRAHAPPHEDIFDDINDGCQPLRLFINQTQGDSATLSCVHPAKLLLLKSLRSMEGNGFAINLAAKIETRFATTADGIRCETAFILTLTGLLNTRRMWRLGATPIPYSRKNFGGRLLASRERTIPSGKRLWTTQFCCCRMPLPKRSARRSTPICAGPIHG
jgi:hypothetical protein